MTDTARSAGDTGAGIHIEIRPGVYHDSVTLLQVSRDVTALDGVDDAVVAMATDLNLGIIADLGFDRGRLDDAGPNDLVVAVRAADRAVVDDAVAAVDRALATSGTAAADTSGAAGPPPRTVQSAARAGDADLAVISVPGEHAFVEAMDALRAGLHVMVFSDNVPVEQEVALKAEGRRRGLLVMGPDCGTAIVGGVGLGFANVVRPGPVGLVAASGTGAQQLCCLLDDADVGVRHVLGVGGRDLSARVGAASTLAALAALDADAGTDLIVVVSKPPDAGVATRVRDEAAACATPVVLGFVGRHERDLTAVADEVVERSGRSVVPHRRWGPDVAPPTPGLLRGLFSGGTLCDEAMVIAADALGTVRSNIPLEPGWELTGDDDGAHTMIDFGTDDMTQGRPHPMIDHSLRLAALDRAARRGDDTVVLLDVVLGHGADADPAGALAPAIGAARRAASNAGRRLSVVVSLCGTRDDPQGRDHQAATLADAGAVVHLSNAQAAYEAVRLLAEEPA